MPLFSGQCVITMSMMYFGGALQRICMHWYPSRRQQSMHHNSHHGNTAQQKLLETSDILLEVMMLCHLMLETAAHAHAVQHWQTFPKAVCLAAVSSPVCPYTDVIFGSELELRVQAEKKAKQREKEKERKRAAAEKKAKAAEGARAAAEAEVTTAAAEAAALASR